MIGTARAIGAALLVALAPAPLLAKPAGKPAARTDWTRVVAATPEGGFRMGNPAAPVKLVEYGSLACPHCRHFEETGYKPLVQSYVGSGRVSYEFRNFLLNSPDVAISLLARCAGPGKFFPMSEVVFATQPQWEDKIDALSGADKAAIDKMTPAQQFVRLADVAGFLKVAARFGIPAAHARQCLTDPKGLDRLVAITKKAEDLGVKGTPTFLINGKIADGASWEQIEPQLKTALGGRG